MYYYAVSVAWICDILESDVTFSPAAIKSLWFCGMNSNL